jgi:hypothetical protein
MEALVLAGLLAAGVGLAALFGKRRPAAAGSRPGPAPVGEPDDDGSVQFEVPAGLTRPPGDWEVFLDHLDVVGERYRLDNVLTFFREVQAASARAQALETFERRYFGVVLRREPGNPVDPLAVAVDGFWLTDPKFAGSQQSIHIGYLPANMAARIRDRLVPDAELGAELVAIEIDPEEEDDMLNVTIHVLNRPGDSLQPARRR